MSRNSSLRQAIIAIRAGRKANARRLLSQMLEANPKDEDAWLWMCAVVDTDEQRIDCLRQVLAINPDNASALEALARVERVSPASRVDSGPAASEPASLSRASGLVDAPGNVRSSQYAGPLTPQATPAPSPESSRDAPTEGPVVSPEGTDVKRRFSLSIMALCGVAALVGCALLLGVCLVSRILLGWASDPWLVAGRGLSVAPLEFSVIDAEYSRTLDRIILVSDDPPQLHIYDPATDTDTRVDLSASPTRVSVGPDGRFAVVGHSRHISYIDLETAQVAEYRDLAADVHEAILAGNGWTYVLAGDDREPSFHAIGMETGETMVGRNVLLSRGTVLRLHPDGSSLYAPAGTTRIDKVTIIDGALTESYNYTSPYLGDSGVCGDLWLSEDGKRIFTACGNVYRSSSNRDLDMAYAGSLTSLGYIHYLVHSSSAGLVLAVGVTGHNDEDLSPVENCLVIFDYQNLTRDDVVTLPNLVVNGRAYAANGRFVFVNAAGTQYYVIVQAGSDSNSPAGFGVVVGKLSREGAGETEVPPEQAGREPSASPESPYAPLLFQVIDAEYSLALDRLVMISDDPAQLHVYDAATGTDTTVDLSRSPTSVSVGPDGSFAAVGHDGQISYVDLENARVVKMLDVTRDVCDVVLADNGWVYASPRRDQWETLRAVHIETNSEVESTGSPIYAGSVFKLHPDGQSLYGVERGLSPSDIQKLDISDGVPAYAYDSPYHCDYYMRGDLWLSEDGQRIFTAGGSVFRASSDPEDDMTYVGTLADLERIRHLVHSSSAGLILLIPSKQPWVQYPSPGTRRVLIFGYESLELERTVTLPEYVVNGLPYAAIGRFVFVNASGTQYYVIVQAEARSGLLYDFGIFTGEL